MRKVIALSAALFLLTGSTFFGPDQGGGPGSDTTAIHDDTAAEISAVASKAVPIAGDYILIEDSAVGDAKKSITIGTLPAGGGLLVQTSFVQDGAVATGTGTIPDDDTIPQITEGTEYMTLSHTPLNAANLLYIQVSGYFENPNQSRMTMALFKDAVANALFAAKDRGDNGDPKFMYMSGQVVAGGTSAITFRLRAGADANGTSTTFNGDGGTRVYGGVMASNITIFEVEP